jgi:hypothetical protein
MQKPTFRYQQDPFRIFSTNPEPILANKNKTDYPIYYNPIKKKNNLIGLLFAIFALVGIVLLFVYRKTIFAFIVKLEEKLKVKEIGEPLKLDEFSEKKL